MDNEVARARKFLVAFDTLVTVRHEYARKSFVDATILAPKSLALILLRATYLKILEVGSLEEGRRNTSVNLHLQPSVWLERLTRLKKQCRKMYKVKRGRRRTTKTVLKSP